MPIRIARGARSRCAISAPANTIEMCSDANAAMLCSSAAADGSPTNVLSLLEQRVLEHRGRRCRAAPLNSCGSVKAGPIEGSTK